MAKKLNVLIVGSGGRESAFGWAVKKSPRCGEVYFLPGNGGTAIIGIDIPFPSPNWELLPDLVKRLAVDLVIVGPEAPIAEGLVDILQAAHIPVVGPTRRAAKIEWSKVFAKHLMEDWDVPTAPFQIFHEYRKAISYVRSQKRPLFIKASGLCAGKGAFPCHTVEEAEKALYELMEQRVLGDAANEVVIEDMLQGYELSIHAFTDGASDVFAPATQDYKRLLPDGKYLPDGRNPNTGGMGAVGPLQGLEKYTDEIDRIVDRTLRGINDRVKEPYTGILYPGLMITADGPKVLEFNARGGDPETQVLMRLLKSDAIDLFEMVAVGRLHEIKVEWHELFAVCIVLVAGGYPDTYEKGFFIRGIDEAEQSPGVVVFHAGTRLDTVSGFHFTSGGRVFNVTATGSTLREALDRAYEGAALIDFEGKYYRRDIGKKALEHTP